MKKLPDPVFEDDEEEGKGTQVRARHVVYEIWREVLHDKIAAIGLVLFCLILIATFFLAFTLDEGYATRVTLRDRDQGPSELHMLGTDEGGRPIIGMMILGARNSILVAFAVTLLSSSFGLIIGLVSGYFGGNVDNVIMRFIDTVIMLPFLMIVITIVSMMPNYRTIHFILVLAAFSWMGSARMTRAMALQQRNLDYVAASKTLGTRHIVIMLREVLPNIVPFITVNLTLSLAGNMGVETGLTFLGFGLPFGTPSLGYLLTHARLPAALQFRWWQWIPAAFMIFLLMMCVYAVGQAVQRAADAKQRRT